MRLPGYKRAIVIPEASTSPDTVLKDEVAVSAADEDRPDEPAKGPSWIAALEAVGAVVAPVTFLSALAYYFGWTRTNTLVAHFGLDHSVIGFSTQDYVLRSVDALFVPLGAALLIALLCLGAHAAMISWIDQGADRRVLRWVARGCFVAGAVFLMIGIDALFGLTRLPIHYLLGSLSPGIGAALIGYGGFLRSRLNKRSKRKTIGRTHWHVVSLTTLLIAFIGLSLFWAASEYASELGESRALRIQANLERLPDVSVLSKQRLQVDAPGTTETFLGNRRSAYNYRVSGLKLLIRSGEKYFLLSDGWTPSRGVAVVLADTPDLRVEFTRGDQ